MLILLVKGKMRRINKLNTRSTSPNGISLAPFWHRATSLDKTLTSPVLLSQLRPASIHVCEPLGMDESRSKAHVFGTFPRLRSVVAWSVLSPLVLLEHVDAREPPLTPLQMILYKSEAWDRIFWWYLCSHPSKVCQTHVSLYHPLVLENKNL